MNTAPQAVLPLAFLDERATGSAGSRVHQLAATGSSDTNHHQHRTTEPGRVTNGANCRRLCVNRWANSTAVLADAVLADGEQLAALEQKCNVMARAMLGGEAAGAAENIVVHVPRDPAGKHARGHSPGAHLGNSGAGGAGFKFAGGPQKLSGGCSPQDW